MNSSGEQRLDKWLWYARIAKSRSLAAKLIEDGSIRINRQRVVKASACVKCGDVLTASLHGQIRLLQVLSLGVRRGPANEAQALYSELPLSGVQASAREEAEK